jgi:hypothetical protein
MTATAALFSRTNREQARLSAFRIRCWASLLDALDSEIAFLLRYVCLELSLQGSHSFEDLAWYCSILSAEAMVSDEGGIVSLLCAICLFEGQTIWELLPGPLSQSLSEERHVSASIVWFGSGALDCRLSSLLCFWSQIQLSKEASVFWLLQHFWVQTSASRS